MLLFHTDNLPRHGLERIFELAVKAGFDGIEIGVNQNLDTQNPGYLKELSDRHNLPIKAFSLDVKHDEALLKAYQSTVREFGGCTLNLHPPGSFSFKYQRWLNEIAPKLAKKYRHQLCFRNLPHESMLGMIPKRKHNNLDALKEKGSVCLDLTASALSNEDIMQALNTRKSKMRHVYVSNLHRHAPYSMPDRGILPLESFLTKLAQNDFRGDFTLRVAARHLQEGNEEVTLQKMKEACAFFSQYFTHQVK